MPVDRPRAVPDSKLPIAQCPAQSLLKPLHSFELLIVKQLLKYVSCAGGVIATSAKGTDVAIAGER